jgi:hypothetical protein
MAMAVRVMVTVVRHLMVHHLQHLQHPLQPSKQV